LFTKRQPIQVPRTETKKEDEVTDIIDDSDIITQPLGQSITKEQMQSQKSNTPTRPMWGNSKPVKVEDFKADDAAD